ncbi:MAG: hypothetical protein K6G62_03400 [Eubacterium sp.]|nr:hypothetical protein [Eubacterium sp.]
MKLKKIFSILLVLGALVLIGSGGYAFISKLKDPKADAYLLLAQFSNRMEQSYLTSQLGGQDLILRCLGKGSDIELNLSDIELEEEAYGHLPECLAKIQDLSLNVNAQTMGENQACRISGYIENSQGKSIQADYFIDQDNLQYSLPDLYGLTVSEERGENQVSGKNLNFGLITRFFQDFKNFFQEELESLDGEISCQKQGNGTEEGYLLSLSPEGVDVFMEDLKSFVADQEEFVKLVNENVRDENFDLLTQVNQRADAIAGKNQSYSLHVKGKQKTLTSLQLDGQDLGSLSFAMAQKGEVYERVISYESNNQAISFSLNLEEEGREICKQTCKFSYDYYGHRGTIKTKTSLSTQDHSILFEINWKNLLSITASGMAKDLVAGKSLTLDLEDVELALGGKNMAYGEVVFSLATREGEISPLKVKNSVKAINLPGDMGFWERLGQNIGDLTGVWEEKAKMEAAQKAREEAKKKKNKKKGKKKKA